MLPHRLEMPSRLNRAAPLHSRRRHVLRHRHNPRLQSHPPPHLACPCRRLSFPGCLRLVRRLNYLHLRLRLLLPCSEQRSDARGAGPGAFGIGVKPCKAVFSDDAVVLEEVYDEAGCGTAETTL